MADAFTKAQFMEPPSFGGVGPVPVGAVKAGAGIEILSDGTINATAGGGTISNVIATDGIQGGGRGPEVFLGLLPPAGTTLGGVKTVAGSGISIDNTGVIRAEVTSIAVSGGVGIRTIATSPSSAVVELKPAGVNSAGSLGGIYLDSTSNLSVDANGLLSLKAATSGTIGGIRPGVGCTVTNGVLNVSNTGTITSVGAGTGLLGGGVTGAVVLSLAPPSGTTIGGVYAGDNIVIDSSGRISSLGGGGGGGNVDAVQATAPITVTGTLSLPVVGINTASTTQAGATQLYDGIDSTSVSLAATANSVKTVYTVANNALVAATGALPLSGGTMTGNITFNGSQTFPNTLPLSGGSMGGIINFGAGQTFPGVLQLSGGTMSGSIVFAGGQTFPGTLSQGAISGTGAIQVSGSTSAPTISVNTASVSQLGVVQPDGTTLTIDGNGVLSVVGSSGALPLTGGTMLGNITFAGTQLFPGVLPTSGGTMTGAITFAAGQTISGYIPDNLLTGQGDIIYASNSNTPARLPLGSAGSILAVNSGFPSWRTPAQLSLLTTTQAATTYAPIDSPVFTGPATINAGGGAGANALTVSGGNLVLSTSFTPASSSSTGSVGEIAWGGGYLYFCYAANTWGRVQIDLTPF